MRASLTFIRLCCLQNKHTYMHTNTFLGGDEAILRKIGATQYFTTKQCLFEGKYTYMHTIIAYISTYIHTYIYTNELSIIYEHKYLLQFHYFSIQWKCSIAHS